MKVGDFVVDKYGHICKITDASVYNLLKVEYYSSIIQDFYSTGSRIPCEQFRLASPEEIASIIAEKMLK